MQDVLRGQNFSNAVQDIDRFVYITVSVPAWAIDEVACCRQSWRERRRTTQVGVCFETCCIEGTRRASMHAEITSKNLRVFANAIQCLARIEPSKVQWEASASGVRAARLRRTSYALLSLSSSFLSRSFCVRWMRVKAPSSLSTSNQVRRRIVALRQLISL